jgi:superfamily II DNA or RNA helicase
MGRTKKFGLLSGNSKDIDVDYLFSTMQMMAKSEVRERFSRNHFNTIIVDEAHRVGAFSYKRIIDYFKPDFWLGMTASPERTDDYDVYSVFHHNIAGEIRLQSALENNLLCPFHYFGITDLEINGESVGADNLEDFNKLVADNRVGYIVKQIEFYGYSGDRVKGLVFCSSREESRILSRKFNEKGYSTISIDGSSSQEAREEAIERLVTNNLEIKLDYVFTVDIFNEGVDIPEVNQVVLLRPTESPIIFVQQLGRGLRKAKDKEFVVILDFIGNYRNNFMIPIALSGDRTYNKDNIRRFMREGERILPGTSTIHFDEITKKRIFTAIDTANFTDVRLIREHYKNLRYKLGRIPALEDFDKFGEMDIMRIFDNKSLGSYYRFLVKYEPDYRVRLSEVEEKIVEFISRKLANGKRAHELILLNLLIVKCSNPIEKMKDILLNEYNIILTDQMESNVINVMTNEFATGSGKKTFKDCIFLEMDNGSYKVSDHFNALLGNEKFVEILLELTSFGLDRYSKYYSNRYKGTNWVLYEKYTYEDVCRLLGWEYNEVPLNIGGYKLDKKTKTFPVFINYHKEEHIQDTIKYEDRFVNQSELIAISKQGRSVGSDDIQNFLNAEDRGIKVDLLVRKNKDDKESKEFYYLGRMFATGQVVEFTMANTDKTAVEIYWKLDMPVQDDIYDYIVNG